MRELARFDSNRVRLCRGEYERQDHRYEYRYSLFGETLYIYAKTLEELREKEKRLPVHETGRMGASCETLTVNDVYEIWKEIKRGIRDSTRRNYCYLYEMYVKKTIGLMPIVSVKKTDIKRFFNYLKDQRNLRLGTIDGVQSVLHHVLQIAVDDELLQRNPADRAIQELMRSRNLHREKRQALTRDEQKLLLCFLSKNTPYRRWYPITLVLLETGLRIGEAAGLRWCDLDLERGLIHVDHTLVYYRGENGNMVFSIHAPKTSASRRSIPMTEAVKKALFMEQSMQEDLQITCQVVVDGYTDFVFLNRFGGALHQGTLNRVFKRIIRDCNDEELLRDKEPAVLLPDFSCHTLRHTFATRLCEAEVNIKAVQGLMGHADITTTMDIYTSVTEELSDQGIRKLEEYLLT